jgi:hypothetical protein
MVAIQDELRDAQVIWDKWKNNFEGHLEQKVYGRELLDGDCV